MGKRLLIGFFFLFPVLVWSQRSFGGVPVSLQRPLAKQALEAKAIKMPNTKGKVPSMKNGFSIPFYTSISIKNATHSETLKDGGVVRTFKIQSEGAAGLFLFFEDFMLREGARLFVFSEDQSTVLGAYTHLNNTPSGKFMIGAIPGEVAIVEWYEPKRKTGELPSNFIINRVDGLTSVMNGLGLEDSECQTDAVCYDGLDEVKKGICRIVIVVEEGMGFCTGTLINNTALDQRPLVLSAFHCSDGYTPLYDLWRFDFQFEQEQCGAGLTEVPFSSIIGAEVLAGRRENDFILFELQDTIPPNYKVTYNGWNRIGEAPTKSVVFHHPAGIEKMVAASNEAAVVFGGDITWNNNQVVDGDTLPVVTPPGHHFRVRYNQGLLIEGSSGAPLLDSAGSVIGQLHGGNAICDGGTGYFGRLNLSWEGGGTAESRLMDWLDPLGTETVALEKLVADTVDMSVLSGQVVFNEEGMPNVLVRLLKEESMELVEEVYTDTEGLFELSRNPIGNYLIQFEKPDRATNGVSTLDIILIHGHIIGVQPFDNNRIMAASDINESGSVSTLDRIKIQKVILGIDNTLGDFSEWLFFDDDAQIPTAGYPITLRKGEQSLSISGVKLGDVNFSAQLN